MNLVIRTCRTLKLPRTTFRTPLAQRCIHIKKVKKDTVHFAEKLEMVSSACIFPGICTGAFIGAGANADSAGGLICGAVVGGCIGGLFGVAAPMIVPAGIFYVITDYFITSKELTRN